MGDDADLFEEPVGKVVRRLTLLTLRLGAVNERAIAAVLAVLILLLLLSLCCASFPCVCFTLSAFPLV